MTSVRQPAVVPVALARRIFLGAQGLLDDPERPASLAAVRRLVQALGFVQVDSINVVERAQHLTLFARLHGYRPAQLKRLVEDERFLFEHWTHDAALIPTCWYAHWKHRFASATARFDLPSKWLAKRLGDEPQAVIAAVRARIEREGPLRSQDFEDDRDNRSAGWWNWKPAKAALEVLWRRGELAIARRDGFQKVCDLAERVYPAGHRAAMPERHEHVAWACAGALDRLRLATARELAAFWGTVEVAEARAWCAAEVQAGWLEPVLVAAADGQEPAAAVVRPGWRARARDLPDAPTQTRLLGPFDPVLQDRARARRRFAFDYTVEAFTPVGRRRFGYYVLAILEGERLVGRLDPKLDRDRGALEVRGLWWEPGVRPTRARQRRLDAALARLTSWLGASRVELPSAQVLAQRRG
jgi:uncharacterized protein YcaQ